MRSEPASYIPSGRLLWSLLEDVLVETSSDERQVTVRAPWGDVRVDDADALVREALHRMTFGPVALENIPALRDCHQAWRAGRTDVSCAEWQRVKSVLARLGGCVVHSLGSDDGNGPVLSVTPIARDAPFRLPAVGQHSPIRLSRFAALRTDDGELVLESPLSAHQVRLHKPPATWVAASLGRPTTVATVADALALPRPLITDVVSYLAAAGMVLIGRAGRPPGSTFAEDTDARLAPWSHHDLLFHARSQTDQYDDPLGAVFRYAEHHPPPDVVVPQQEQQRFPLRTPDLAELMAADPPLTETIEASASSQVCSDEPCTERQLGELLFRVARSGQVMSPTLDRPFPELELYLSTDRCPGLPRGIYHYDATGHALRLINSSEWELTELLETARMAAGMGKRPPTLITVTARIARFSRIYRGIAYATAVRHAGMLQQTLDLVATAMGLVPCTLAFQDRAATNAALRINWPTEVAIGEFIIGAKT